MQMAKSEFRTTLLGVFLTALFVTIGWAINKFFDGLILQSVCVGDMCLTPLVVSVFGVAILLFLIILLFLL